MTINQAQLTNNQKLLQWVSEMETLCKPEQVYWCDGSTEEYDRIMQGMVDEGLAIPLQKRSNSFLFPFRPLRCCPCGRPHLHCQPKTGRRRTNQQLD